MLQLPPDFNVSTFISDYYGLAIPFLTISALYLAARLIKKALSGRI